MDVCVCERVHNCPPRPGEGVSVPGAWVSGNFEPLSVVLGIDNVGSLQEQQALLAMESTFLAPLHFILRL